MKKVFRFIQEGFTREQTTITLEEMDHQFQKLIELYNTWYVKRDTVVVPQARLKPYVIKSLNGTNLADTLCFKEIT